MTAFPPRPWRCERDQDGWEVYDANGDPVASVGVGRDGREAQEEAIARFLAAAPEMYELLRRCRNALVMRGSTTADDDVLNQAVALLAGIDGEART